MLVQNLHASTKESNEVGAFLVMLEPVCMWSWTWLSVARCACRCRETLMCVQMQRDFNVRADAKRL